MDNDDLDLVPTDDLIDALRRRQGDRGAVLVVMLSDENENEEGKVVAFRGGMIAAIGLAEYARHRLLTSEPLRLSDPDDHQ